jgi:hypothetical protein
MQGAFPGNVSGAGAADGAMFAPGVSRGEVERAYMSGKKTLRKVVQNEPRPD